MSKLLRALPHWLQEDWRLNPHRPRKIRKRISSGVGKIADFFVRVEFPVSGDIRIYGPVDLYHAGYIKYEDFGTSEVMDNAAGLTYSASEPGVRKADLFVLVYRTLGHTNQDLGDVMVRRIFMKRVNGRKRLQPLLKLAARKVALSVNKDERILMRRLQWGE